MIDDDCKKVKSPPSSFELASHVGEDRQPSKAVYPQVRRPDLAFSHDAFIIETSLRPVTLLLRARSDAERGF